MVSITPRPPLPPGKDPVPIVQEAGWAPEPVWIGAENLAPTGFDPRTFQPVASRYTDYALSQISMQKEVSFAFQPTAIPMLAPEYISADKSLSLSGK